MSKTRRNPVKQLVLPMLAGALLGLPAEALPTDPTVTHGDVTIHGSAAGTLQVLQGSNQAIVNWNSFGIAPGELVQFIQPSAMSAILNRVTGVDPSRIMGTLTANGHVFLLNPNGILFGKDSVVNVGSFMASTLKMSDQDFLNKTFNLVQDPTAALAAVVNQGTIRVADGGYLVLVSPFVGQEGLVIAKGGQIALGAGTQATVNFDGSGLMNFAVANSVPETTTVVAPQEMLAAVRGVVSNAGLSEALAFDPMPQGVLVNSGQTRADSDGAQAGRVVLDSTTATYVSPSGVVSANGLTASSSGGDARVLSHGLSSLQGRLEVRGGAEAKGGFAELSGKHFQWAGTVDNGGGTPGQFLLDPTNIIILPGDKPPGAIDDPNTPNNPKGVTLGNGDDVVYAVQLATVDGVTLQADNDIRANIVPLGTFDISHNGDATLTATNGSVVFFPTDTMNIPRAAGGQGAHVEIRAPKGSVTLPNIVRAGNGSLLVRSGGTLTAPNVDLGVNSMFDVSSTNGDVLIQGSLLAETVQIGSGRNTTVTRLLAARDVVVSAGNAPGGGNLTLTVQQPKDGEASAEQLAWRPLISATVKGDVDIKSFRDKSVKQDPNRPFDLEVNGINATGSVNLTSDGSIRNNVAKHSIDGVDISGGTNNTITAGTDINLTAKEDVRVGKVFSKTGNLSINAGGNVTYRELITGTDGKALVVNAGIGVFGPTTFADGFGIASDSVKITAPTVADLGPVSATNLSIQANSTSDLNVTLSPSNAIYDPPAKPGSQPASWQNMPPTEPDPGSARLLSNGFGRKGTHLQSISSGGNVTITSTNTIYVGNVTAIDPGGRNSGIPPVGSGHVVLQVTDPGSSILVEPSLSNNPFPADGPRGIVGSGGVTLSSRGPIGDLGAPIPVQVDPGSKVVISAPNRDQGIRVYVSGAVPPSNVQFDVLTPPESILFNSRSLFESLVSAAQEAPRAEAQSVAVLTSFLNQSNFVGIYTLNLSNVVTQDDWKSLLSGAVLWEEGEQP